MSNNFSKIDGSVRAALYQWLARVYSSEQTPETIAGYRSTEGREALNRFADIPGQRKNMAGIAALADNWKDSRSAALDLATAYARLFLVGGPSQVPIFESVYTSEKRLICQRSAADMEELLRRHGLSADGWREPVDHLSIELTLLAQLTAAAEASADPAAAEGRRELLSRHLLVWAPAFCELCIARDDSGFYAAAARVLEAALATERAALEGPDRGAGGDAAAGDERIISYDGPADEADAADNQGTEDLQ